MHEPARAWSEPAGRAGHVRARRGGWCAVLLVVLLVATTLSLAVGARPLSITDVIGALFGGQNTAARVLILDLRLPRTLIGILVGSALGIAGVLMQTLTRNPLADPGILGVNAGASFGVVLAIAVGLSGPWMLVWFAFVGAGVAASLVQLLGLIAGGSAPGRTVLAGAALGALFTAFSSAISLHNADRLDQYRYWAVGTLAGRSYDQVRTLVWFFLIGVAVAWLLSPALNAIALGDDVAASLGVRVTVARVCCQAAIALLCGTAVSAAGPIGFIGLVVPQVTRRLWGTDLRVIIPLSGIVGASFLLLGDVLGRVIARPGEIQVAIITAGLGGTVFVFLVRRLAMGR